MTKKTDLNSKDSLSKVGSNDILEKPGLATNEKGNSKSKKAYKSPSLVDHGDALELTQSGGSAASDFFGGFQA